MPTQPLGLYLVSVTETCIAKEVPAGNQIGSAQHAQTDQLVPTLQETGADTAEYEAWGVPVECRRAVHRCRDPHSR